jgi:hypothetical protein
VLCVCITTHKTHGKNDPSLWDTLAHRREHTQNDWSHNNGSTADSAIGHFEHMILAIQAEKCSVMYRTFKKETIFLNSLQRDLLHVRRLNEMTLSVSPVTYPRMEGILVNNELGTT